jgi:CRISPR-associated protein Cmr1
MEFALKAVTDIWTGGVEGNSRKLHLTGIKGSIRWWYETLVRGLGGYACNPTSEYKCPEVKEKDAEKVLNNICPVCRFLDVLVGVENLF